MGKPVQTLGGAMAVLGTHKQGGYRLGSGQKAYGSADQRRTVGQGQSVLDPVATHSGLHARILGGMLELDVERCFLAGMLQSLGDLAVLGLLQEWLLAGGELNEQVIDQALEQYSASFGSALHTAGACRWSCAS
ncbi:HDOD domain-containing protein [Pseudomonas syringae]|uniref:HDOD domain-containing protein n=1 Tax=Pseudomonas syringae TaxID=317 RepID=UPI003F7767F1